MKWQAMLQDIKDQGALKSRIIALLDHLNADELEVAHAVLERVAGPGVKAYGHLDIDSDKRDFAQEAYDEHLDATWYLGVAHVKRRRAGR